MKSECITEKANDCMALLFTGRKKNQYYSILWIVNIEKYALFGHSRSNLRVQFGLPITKNWRHYSHAMHARFRFYTFYVRVSPYSHAYVSKCQNSWMAWHQFNLCNFRQLSRFTNYRSDANDYGHQYDLLI